MQWRWELRVTIVVNPTTINMKRGGSCFKPYYVYECGLEHVPISPSGLQPLGGPIKLYVGPRPKLY